MWICSSLGFFSVVEKRPGEFHVRARRHGDLVNLKTAAKLPLKIHESNDQLVDYRFRIVCHAKTWRRIADTLATSVNYPNFKGRISRDPDQCEKMGPYHDFHTAMKDYQDGFEVAPRRLR
jgi:hypothetical protein